MHCSLCGENKPKSQFGPDEDYDTVPVCNACVDLDRRAGHFQLLVVMIIAGIDLGLKLVYGK